MFHHLSACSGTFRCLLTRKYSSIVDNCSKQTGTTHIYIYRCDSRVEGYIYIDLSVQRTYNTNWHILGMRVVFWKKLNPIFENKIREQHKHKCGYYNYLLSTCHRTFLVILRSFHRQIFCTSSKQGINPVLFEYRLFLQKYHFIWQVLPVNEIWMNIIHIYTLN